MQLTVKCYVFRERTALSFIDQVELSIVLILFETLFQPSGFVVGSFGTDYTLKG